MRADRSTIRSSWTRTARLRALGVLLLGGCAPSSLVTATVQHPGARLGAGRWVLLPLMNYSDTPPADESARALLSTLLRARGLETLAEPPPAAAPDQPLPDLDGRLRLERAMAWARSGKFTLGLTGSVDEWRYRTSSDGSPAAAVSLSLVDVETGVVLWTASGARAGSAGSTVSGTALQLLQDLLGGLELRR